MSKISESIETIFSVISVIKKAKSEDSAGGSKITLTEKIKIGISALSLVKIVTAFSDLKEEWQNGGSAIKQEIFETFQEKFDIEDDELEASIENLVNTVINFETVLGIFSGDN